MEIANEYRHFDANELNDFVSRIFCEKGFGKSDALLCSQVLIAADLRGIDSHGVARLSGYCRLIDIGRINPKPNIKVLRNKGINCSIDADAAIGLVSAPFAMDIALDKLEIMGGGFTTICNSNHFGIAAYHAMKALSFDAIGFSMTNASPLVSPARGKERMLGTNPICLAVPANLQIPFVLDMATSTAANGKLEIASRKKQEIPLGWLMDQNGHASVNPNELKNKGNLLPLGSDKDGGVHKGYGLSAWVDIFSGVLSGANYGPWVPPFVSFLNPIANQPGKGLGHFVGAWAIDGFMEPKTFKARMDHWIKRFKESTPIDTHEPVIIPGELEHNQQINRLKNGIPLHTEVIADLKVLAKSLKTTFIHEK